MPIKHARKALSYITPLGFKEPLMLLIIIVITGASITFVELAEEITNGQTHAVDSQILLSMRNPHDVSDPIGPLWFEEMARDVTAMGGVALLSLLTGIVIIYLILQRKTGMAVFVLISTVGGSIIGVTLKEMFERSRPDLVTHLSHGLNSSFPSGHSMMAAVTYLTLGALLGKSQKSRTLKIYFISIAILLTVCVGASRVYLGVHWPTDVLAGWCVGAVWALLCWYMAHWLQLLGTIEPENMPPAP